MAVLPSTASARWVTSSSRYPLPHNRIRPVFCLSFTLVLLKLTTPVTEYITSNTLLPQLILTLMFWRSKLNITLLVLPIILLFPLFYVASWRPRPIMGVDGRPALLSDLPAAIAYSPNGTLIAATEDGAIHSYRPDEKQWVRNRDLTRLSGFRTGEIENTKLGPFNIVPTQKLRFSSDGKTLFAAGAFTSTLPTIQALDVQTLKPLYSFGLPEKGIFDVSTDGKWAIYGTRATLGLIDLTAKPLPREPVSPNATRSKPADFREYPSRIFRTVGSPICMKFSPDSKNIAVAIDHHIRLFDLEKELLSLPAKEQLRTGSIPNLPRTRFDFKISNPRRVEWSNNGSMLAVNSDVLLSILDTSLTQLATTKFSAYQATSAINSDIVWANDDRTIFTGGTTIRRWKLSDSAADKKFTISQPTDYDTSGPIALSPDGRFLLTTYLANTANRDYIVQWRIP
jgi:dipeptidyl aminopeptidase/acylaminoacyl peptidase